MSRGIATTAATKTYSCRWYHRGAINTRHSWSPRGTIGSESRDLYAQSRCNYVFILVTESRDLYAQSKCNYVFVLIAMDT